MLYLVLYILLCKQTKCVYNLNIVYKIQCKNIEIYGDLNGWAENK